ncbi:MAG TPA: glutathione S-transferase N-terminal domain-containing protein [Solirubrobacteraceae bacterium]|nr:glutathione S-transferase N-terminal domain-containing protein [Solirubrobacteraceae bacterium]
MSGKLKLYMFPGSNSVMTGKLMLEHKGIDYQEVKLMPGPHAFIMLGLGFETMGVPAVKFKGRRVQGTRWIARYLDEIVPARPLFPADPARRKAVQDAERWGEDFQNATRRIFYYVARRDPKAFTSFMTPRRSRPMRVALRLAKPVIIRLATGAHRASDAAGREDLELLGERLDQIDAWIEQGILNGPELNAADFQIAPNVSGLLLSDDLAPYIRDRPAAAFAARVAPGYAGHLAAVIPNDALAPLRNHRRPALDAGPPAAELGVHDEDLFEVGSAWPRA